MRKYIFLLIVGLFLVACSDARSHHPGNPGTGSTGVGATLTTIGDWFTWVGAIGMGIGAIGAFASIFIAALKPVAELLGEIAACGFVAILIGCSLIWLGNNPWLLVVCIGLVCVLLLIRYRDGVIILWNYIVNTPKKRRKKTSQPLS